MVIGATKRSGLVLVALLAASLAHADQQTPAQQACINANNKSMAKVAATQLKVIRACAKKFAQDKIASADDCVAASSKVAEAQAKTLETETAKCTEAPDFGPTSGAQVNDAAEQYANQMPEDLFESGVGLDSGLRKCPADSDGCACQAAGLKAANKVFTAVIKDFNGCKKKGIKKGTIPDGPTLVNCVGDDAKGKIEKASAKVADAVAAKCTGPDDDYFPGAECTGLTGTALSNCLVSRALCMACHVVVYSDDLINQACDVLDDGFDNHSCGGI